MKKAQGISINTIIIAAIALLFLIILIAVFTGRIGNWGRGLDETSNAKCPGAPDTIVSAQDCSVINTIYGKFEGVKSGQVCCKEGSQVNTESVTCSHYNGQESVCNSYSSCYYDDQSLCRTR
jgi:hypothetical protein